VLEVSFKKLYNKLAAESRSIARRTSKFDLTFVRSSQWYTTR